MSDNGNLADAMADYYTFLAPLTAPCQVRWRDYTDIVTGEAMLAACLPAYKKADTGSADSCSGGTAGTMPQLLGVACMDTSLIVSKATLQARPDAQEFFDLVAADQAACGTVATPTEAQLETLRARITFGNAVCGTASPPSTSPVRMMMKAGDEAPCRWGLCWVPVAGVSVLATAVFLCLKTSQASKRAKRPPTIVSSASSRERSSPQQVVQTNVTVTPTVVMQQPVMMQQPMAWHSPWACAQPMGMAPPEPNHATAQPMGMMQPPGMVMAQPVYTSQDGYGVPMGQPA